MSCQVWSSIIIYLIKVLKFISTLLCFCFRSQQPCTKKKQKKNDCALTVAEILQKKEKHSTDFRITAIFRTIGNMTQSCLNELHFHNMYSCYTTYSFVCRRYDLIKLVKKIPISGSQALQQHISDAREDLLQSAKNFHIK